MHLPGFQTSLVGSEVTNTLKMCRDDGCNSDKLLKCALIQYRYLRYFEVVGLTPDKELTQCIQRRIVIVFISIRTPAISI
jgi:hypothetical protein